MNFYIGGLREGYNFPEIKDDKPWLNLEGCKDIIVVDRTYFLEYIGLIHSWAQKIEKEEKEKHEGC